MSVPLAIFLAGSAGYQHYKAEVWKAKQRVKNEAQSKKREPITSRGDETETTTSIAFQTMAKEALKSIRSSNG
ncbi:MAG: hypothetical protein AAFP90_14750 [Planctomycetota bacterium]